MKKLITTILALIFALSIGVMVTACGDDEGNKNAIVDVRTKTITVGYTDYAPMNYKENGVLKGFDTELALMTFNALGYEVRFKLIEWGNKYLELNGGTIDCIWNGFTANSEDDGVARAELVNFSYNYLENNQCVVKLASTATITDVAQFNGKSIAFESGSAGEGYVDGLENISINKKESASQLDALRQVNMGTAQYAIVDKTLADNYVGQNDYAALVINEGIEIPVEYYAIGFKKDANGAALRDKVNVILKAFEATGQLQELATKYNLSTRLLTLGA